MPALVLIVFLWLYSSSPSIAFLTFSVIDFGASGDGINYDTSPIQSAIDSCASAGGGRVYFPAGGSFLTGTLFLRSRVVLDIERGARILGGAREEDYPEDSSRWYVVLAENVTEAGITGGGEINGRSEAFVVRFNARKNIMVSWNQTGSCLGDECRPRLVGFLDSHNIRIWNITLNQPAYWCLHIVRCNDTKIHDIAIYGDFNTPNNDGIDIEDSNNTIIMRCHIDTGDDAICPKSSTGPVHNLSATDCWIRTKSSAIKLGSASWFDFRNFLFDNITIVDSHRGLAMQIRDGGDASGIIFSNIKIITRYYDPLWWGRAEPIYMTTCPRVPSSKRGSISNVLFENIYALSENGVFLSGSSSGILSGIKFKNVNLTFKRWTEYPGGLYDYRPGCRELVSHTTSGMMMEHIDGLYLENVSMKYIKGAAEGWVFPLQFMGENVNRLSFYDWKSEIIDSNGASSFA